MGTIKLAERDLLVGARYNLGVVQGKLAITGQRLVKDGTGLVEQEPLSGPIYREKFLTIEDKVIYTAKCVNCGARSEIYVRKSIGMSQWAHKHRCK